jgi:hypothetical protein
MAKHKHIFYANEDEGMIDLLEFFGCYEDIEHIFDIEIACAEKDGTPLFHKDNPNGFHEEYDGVVLDTIFRNADTKVIHRLGIKGYKFQVTYDDETEEFINAKISR